MEPLIIEATDSTPSVKFDPNVPVYQITGGSLPEDTGMFYEPIIDWLNTYPGKEGEIMVLRFNLKPMSSNSLIAVHQILKALKGQQENNEVITGVRWEFLKDDDELERLGSELRSVTGLNFELLPV